MLIDVLREAAADDPARPALIARGRTTGFGELVEQAEALAGGIVSARISRFGIASEDPNVIVPLLAAASAVGVEACVYPRSLTLEAIAGFAERLGHPTVVVDDTAGGAVPGAVAVAELSAPGTVPPRPDAFPVLILTTGTSGTPKGVRHDWKRLIAAVRRADDQAGRRWLLAYNLNQFAGFQVLLHAMVHRSTLVVPDTSQARDAMAALRASKVTHVSATPTFWRLLVGDQDPASTADLALEQITMGGEAAPSSLIERLGRLFPQARITHIYAGTEFGSAVAVTDGLPGLPVSVLDRPQDADVRFRVVDGELHVSSRHGMLGYLEAAEAPAWHATGDLVEERDGRLHFVGRTVEIINVGGAKVHPLPIEELLATVPGIRLAAVYGAPNAITGQIVAVDIVLEPGAEEKAVTKAIHQTCRVLPAPGRPRRVRVVDDLQTLGDKVVRTPEVRS